MAHDFVRFPELRNSQLDFYYWESPHKQIFEDFIATVVKVTDGDTIRVETDFRDFDFPIRILDIDAKELNEGGQEVKKWLADKIEGEELTVNIINEQRVDKWGRLLGKLLFRGMDIGDEMKRTGRATSFDQRREDKIPPIEQELMKHGIKL